MPEFFEKLERKKRLQVKSAKKNRFPNRDQGKENREEDIKIKYKKQYFQHMQNGVDEEEFLCENNVKIFCKEDEISHNGIAVFGPLFRKLIDEERLAISLVYKNFDMKGSIK